MLGPEQHLGPWDGQTRGVWVESSVLVDCLLVRAGVRERRGISGPAGGCWGHPSRLGKGREEFCVRRVCMGCLGVGLKIWRQLAIWVRTPRETLG